MSRFKQAVENINTILAITGFATLCFGAGVSLTLFRVPAATDTAPTHTTRIPCSGEFQFKGVPYKGQPDWLHDHVYWLEAEGDRSKAVGAVAEYMIAEGSHSIGQAVNRCKAILRVDDGYTIHGRTALRLTAGNGRSFERLQISVPSPDLREIHVDIPESGSGDQIVLLFRLDALAGRTVNAKELQERISSRFE